MKLSTGDKVAVVPWDFSEQSRESLGKAVEMIGDLEKIRIVHVTTPLSAVEYGVIWNTLHEDTVVSRLEEEFRRQMKDFTDADKLNFHVMFGDPGIKICAFAKEVDASLVVMPSHGRTGMSRMLMGSVAERVVRFAPCPVLVIRCEPDPETAKSVGAELMTYVV